MDSNKRMVTYALQVLDKVEDVRGSFFCARGTFYIGEVCDLTMEGADGVSGCGDVNGLLTQRHGGIDIEVGTGNVFLCLQSVDEIINGDRLCLGVTWDDDAFRLEVWYERFCEGIPKE